ncbi:MAG: hypothetical protein QOD75_124 [Blastocatellia bacterium]|jgi:hypothetical protein|nr:hypothetical protein [Blastocatellia bacterium]
MKLLPLLLLAIVLLFPITAFSQSPFDGCAPEGKRKKTASNPTGKVPVKEAAMNRMKNRDDITGSIDHSVTIETLMAAKEEADIDPERPIEITGYVADVIPGTPRETCNCARNDIADIHIDVVAKKADRNKKIKYVIVEISPRFVGELGDAASVKAAITNKWVKFTGWPTYDYKHRSNARNIKATGNIWRATAWEVHPVTKFKVVSAP